MIRRANVAFVLLLAPVSLSAATFVVTNVADAGLGSLRQALLDSQATPGSTIAFAIGSGVRTIRPLTELPELTSGLLDGTTQPGYSGSPLIELDGSLLPALQRVLLASGGAHIKAVVANRCPYRAIELHGARVTGSFLGTDVTGMTALGNGVGVASFGGTVGGSSPGEGNVISGNAYGITVGPAFGPTTIQGNLVGTKANGLETLPNLNNGITVDSVSGSSVLIGGTLSGARNVISGNNQYGIELFYSDDVVVQGNIIGPDANGGGSFSNQQAGIVIYQSSRAVISGNTIARHWMAGVGVQPTSNRNRISANSMHSNNFGIDLDFERDATLPERITPNDLGDPDTGPNLLQNFPLIAAVHSVAGTTTVRGSLNSEPGAAFTIELFSSESCNASGNGEGQTYLGSLGVTTNASGDAAFVTTFSVPLPAGHVVTATATDSFGNTSEFSPCGSATPSLAMDFFTLTPCRVVDTRQPAGPLGGPALAPAGRRSFPISGSCAVSSSAKAVSANITITQPSAPGHLVVTAGDLQPAPATSSINFRPGQTRANNVIVPLAADGSIAVENGSVGTVDFILDVNGYFEDAP